MGRPDAPTRRESRRFCSKSARNQRVCFGRRQLSSQRTTWSKEVATPEWVETAKQNLDVADALLARQILDSLKNHPGEQSPKAGSAKKSVKPPRASKPPPATSKFYCDGCMDPITGLHALCSVFSWCLGHVFLLVWWCHDRLCCSCIRHAFCVPDLP